ncbi:hypothetical protein ACX0G9_26830 [Flavitalea flava]
MDKYFAWIISTELYYGLKKGGISPAYVIPAEMMHGHEGSLVRSGVWVVVRGRRDEVAGFIKPWRIERFTDTYYKGDYLLHANLTSSFRIGSPNADGSLFFAEAFNSFPMGINEIDAESKLRIFDFVRSKVQRKFTPPPTSSIKDIVLENAPKRRASLAKIAINRIVRNYSLDTIWCTGSVNKLGPFANFAHALISDRFGPLVAAECLSYLRTYDPLNILLETKDRTSEPENHSSEIRRIVDTEFTEIDPESIYAREFVDSDHIVDLEAALAKTETAEKFHQDMLRDITTYMISRGIIPYETRSVDLMIRWAGRINIYEIKSTNEVNLFAQSAKGSFQLAYYCEAMKDDYDSLNPVLIIRKTHDEGSEKMCINVLRKLGIACLIYDPSCEWPNRIAGLFEDRQ